MYIAEYCRIERSELTEEHSNPKQLVKSQFSIADDFGQSVVNLLVNVVLNVGYAHSFG